MSMTKQELASLVVKIFSLSVIVNAVITSALSVSPYFEQQFYNMTQGITPEIGPGSTPSLAVNDLLALLIPLVIAAFLWTFSDWLGRHMIKDTDEKKTKTSLTSLEIQSLVVAAVGLFVIVNAVPQFGVFLLYLSSPAVPGATFTTIWLQLINPFLYIIVGTFLVIRASKIAKFLQK